MKLLTRKQYDRMLKTADKNTCFFCQWAKYQFIIKEFQNWLWVQNIAPYWYFHTMFVSKRHFVKESEMTVEEMAELIQIKEYAFNAIMKAKLIYPSGKNKGKPVEKFVYFHRFRVNTFDNVSGISRPDHFHSHFTPDIDHRWDSTLDKNAYKYPITDFL